MSHATVLVILKEDENLEDVLAPYDENLEDLERLEFEDRTEALREEYEKEDKKDISFEQFACEKRGYVRKDDKYGYFYNPEGYWDYWGIGGRWSNYLKLKEHVKNKDRVFLDDPKENNPPTHCNECLREDFDYEGQKQEEGKDHLFFAVIKDGEWHQQALLGWFGCTSDEIDNWPEEEARLLSEADPKDTVVLVDYHI